MAQEETTGICLPPIRIIHRSDLRASDEPEAEFRFGKDKRYKPTEGSVEAETHYRRDYTHKPLTLTKIIRPERQRENPGNFVAQPSYKDDYKAYDLSQTERISRQYVYRPPSKKFEGTTNYSLEFIPHTLSPFRNAKPVERPKETDEPFCNATSYRDSFPKYSNLVARQQLQKPRWQPLLIPMSDVTNYRTEFVPRDIQVRKSFKPDTGPLKSEAPFESSTTQKASYIDWKVVKPFVQEKPIYTSPEGEFDFMTTASMEFTPKLLEKIPSKRPPEEKKSLASFDGTTNYELEFRSWPLGERTKPLRKSESLRSDAGFIGEPTYKRDYIAYDVTPRRDNKPNEAPLHTDEPFPTKTDYRESYINYELPSKENQERPVWKPSEIKLDTTTNYKIDFVERDLVETKSCKPKTVPIDAEEPTQYRTTHLDSFTPWMFVNDVQTQKGNSDASYNKDERDADSSKTKATSDD